MAKVEAARGVRRPRRPTRARGTTRRSTPARPIERETGATFVHAFEDPRVIAGQGTLGLELADQLPEGPGTVVVPVGGGGLAVGRRDRARRAAARAARRRRPGGRLRAARGLRADRGDDRRRDRRQASGRAHRRDRPRARSTSSSSSTTRRSPRRSCCCSSARSSSSREPARRPSRRSLAGRVPGEGPACARARGRERRRDDAQLRHPPRPHRVGPPPRGLAADPRPARRARADRAAASRPSARTSSRSTHHREGRSIGVLETEAELTLETRGEEHSQLVIRALAEAGYTVDG